MKKSKCRVCQQEITLGVDGVQDDICDEHAEVERDRNGYAWFPDEREHVYQDVQTGETTIISRKTALRKRKRK